MKIGLIAGGLVFLVFVVREVRRLVREEETMQELDDMLAEIFGDCMEAWCDDCGRVLASGTGTRKPEVSLTAYQHSEIHDHNVHVRSWADG